MVDGFPRRVGIDLVGSFTRSLCAKCVLLMPDFSGMQNVLSAMAPVYMAA